VGRVGSVCIAWWGGGVVVVEVGVGGGDGRVGLLVFRCSSSCCGLSVVSRRTAPGVSVATERACLKSVSMAWALHQVYLRALRVGRALVSVGDRRFISRLNLCNGTGTRGRVCVCVHLGPSAYWWLVLDLLDLLLTGP